MEININIPTYKRYNILDTYGILPNAFYWVHKKEIEDYKKVNKGIKIKELPDELIGNVASVRNYILKKDLEDENIDVSVQIDDDVHYFGYYEKKKIIKINNEEDIRKFLFKFSILAKELGVKLWGINVNSDKQSYREFKPFSFSNYISASFSCFMKGNELYYDERFSLKEDYDMTILQLNKYRKMLRVNKFFYVKKGAEQVGGCANYRNLEKEESQIKLLQKKWGNKIVKFDNRNKSNKIKNRIDINPVIRVPIKGV